MCRHSANLGDLQGRAAWSLLDTTEECFYPFLNRFYQFLTTPQMHLVNIQCDNAPEKALHLTGEEENNYVYFGFRTHFLFVTLQKGFSVINM